MSIDNGARGASGESDEVFSMLRQLDSQIQQRRQGDESRPQQPRPRETTGARRVSMAAELPPQATDQASQPATVGSNALPAPMAAEILARLDRLDTQLRQVQTMVQLEQLESQLRQVKDLVGSGLSDQPLPPTLSALLRPTEASALMAASTAAHASTVSPAIEPRPGVNTDEDSRGAAPVQLPSQLLADDDRSQPSSAVVASTVAASAAVFQPVAPLAPGGTIMPPPVSVPMTFSAPIAAPTIPTETPYLADDDDSDGGSSGGRLRQWIIVGLVLLIVAAVLVAAAIFVPRLLLAPPREPAPIPASDAPTDRIVFQSDRDSNGQPQIYLMRPDGTDVTRLPISVPYAWNPRFSPDGQRIAFVGRIGGADDIFVVNSDGRNLQRVTSKSGNNRHPAWSPDGQWIAFGSDRGGNWDIYVSPVNKPDGTNDARNITNSPTDDNLPSWSPDSTLIAFQSDRTGKMQVYTVKAEGGQAINVSNSQSADSYPQWSPTGQTMTFHSDRTGNSEIFIMNADGSEQHNLTNNPATDELAVWAPDGKAIVFASNRDGNMDLYALRFDNPEVTTRLTKSEFHDWAPSWGR